MAQSSNALREQPTTDEILASIREIIEENTGRVNDRTAAKTSVNNRSAAKATGQQTLNNAQTGLDDLSVDEAMKVLAARIGLKKDSNQSVADAGTKDAFSNDVSAPSTLRQKPVDEPLQSSFQQQNTVNETPQDFNNQPADLAGNTDLAGGQQLAPDNTNYQSIESADLSARQDVETAADNATNKEVNNEDIYSDIHFSPEFWNHVNALAEETLRPILVQWLQKRWPALVEKILREEISGAFKRNFPSDQG
ncbi:DUF2497 domain-containing protein [Bartonella sp. W8097]|uniref:DUF2497 domain-containing protein n=1 Tax=Bartonella apihabitans TaxID=2750929 RepID=UPI0018DC7CEC|nr:DUF2497 domain-containing protein [Bartonella apihabitans]MBI0020649.1 DUF2497 domain-containing protein [Bartonella apihabitans]